MTVLGQVRSKMQASNSDHFKLYLSNFLTLMGKHIYIYIFVDLRTEIENRNTLHYSRLKTGIRESIQFHLDM